MSKDAGEMSERLTDEQIQGWADKWSTCRYSRGQIAAECLARGRDLEATSAQLVRWIDREREQSIRAEVAEATVKRMRELLNECHGEVRAYREVGASRPPFWCAWCRKTGEHAPDCLISEIAAELEGE